MRTKEMKIDGKDVEAVLMAGGPGFKIYSIEPGLLVVAGRIKQVFVDGSPEYRTVINYVNLRYQPEEKQDEVKEKFMSLVDGLKNVKESVEDITKKLDDINNRLYDKSKGFKMKSKLRKKSKSNIPGYGYFFKSN